MFRQPRVAKVKQLDLSDCGVACLASIAAFYGIPTSIWRLRQHSHTDKSGTSLLGLSHAAESIGLTARGLRGRPELLDKSPVPSIVHIHLSNGAQHYMVLERVEPKSVHVMDPIDGEYRRMDRAEFAALWSGVLLELERNTSKAPRIITKSFASRIRSMLRSHHVAIATALLATFLYTALGIASSLFVQQLVDGVLAGRHGVSVYTIVLTMGIVAVVQFVAGVLRSRIMFHVGQRIDATLITDYCAHLFRLPQAFFDQMRVGELTSRVSDATRIRAFFSDALVEAITNTLIVIGASAVLLWRDWRLAATALALLPAASLLYVASTRLNRRVQREVMEKAAALESDLVESIGAIGTIKRHGIEATRIRKTNARLADLLSSVDRSTRGAIWISTSGQLMAQLGAIALLGVGATRVTDAGISLGELMSSYALFGFLAGPLLMLVGVSRSIQEMRTAASRLFDIMDMEPEPDRALDRKSSKSSRHDDSTLHFDNVTFRYNGRRAAIDGFSLQCAPGTLTALVGESGSGKSTIAALAQRLYPAESGRITIGDRDITTLDVVELRRLVGIVPQNIDIFAATILENIALFADDPDMDTVLNVCERTGLSEALQHWPLGMMTMIGERGATLSGGERQRLAIARALYRDPAILVLDEVTSALDSLNEARIVSLMQELAAAGTTVIVIAHRLTTTVNADNIVVLREGRIAEQGSHAALFAADGMYRRIWEHQFPLSDVTGAKNRISPHAAPISYIRAT